MELDDETFMRSPNLRVFISSRMARNVLLDERLAAAEAVESNEILRAWYWERDAAAGPYCAEATCIGYARTSDALILILAEEISPVTRKEYEAASREGKPCLVFVKSNVEHDDETKEFISQVQRHSVTGKFANVSELRTQITTALTVIVGRMYRFGIRREREHRELTLRRSTVSNPFEET
jgi:hypothetical protein